MKCENCPYWTELDTGVCACKFDPNGNWDAPCDEPDPDPVRYTVFLFKGDEVFETDNWDEVHPLIMAYGNDIEVRDNWYDVHWANGEWF